MYNEYDKIMVRFCCLRVDTPCGACASPPCRGAVAHHAAALASYGMLVYGVEGVGKSHPLRALSQELPFRGISVCRVDVASWLIEYAHIHVATAYEFLLQQFEQFFPRFRRQTRDAPAAVGIVLIDDVDVLFPPTSRTADDGDAAATSLSIPLITLCFVFAIQLPRVARWQHHLVSVSSALRPRHVHDGGRETILEHTRREECDEPSLYGVVRRQILKWIKS
jgi:ATPase family associated with various cellular activities (AAA)